MDVCKEVVGVAETVELEVRIVEVIVLGVVMRLGVLFVSFFAARN